MDEQEYDSRIPRLEYVNSRGETGSAEFRDMDDMSTAEMYRLRKGAGSSQNEGEATNSFFTEALQILVMSWEVPGKPDMPIPRQSAKNVTSAPAGFIRELERHVNPHLKRLLFEKKEEDKDPTLPAQG